jgi:hypothetical protein
MPHPNANNYAKSEPEISEPKVLPTIKCRYLKVPLSKSPVGEDPVSNICVYEAIKKETGSFAVELTGYKTNHRICKRVYKILLAQDKLARLPTTLIRNRFRVYSNSLAVELLSNIWKIHLEFCIA